MNYPNLVKPTLRIRSIHRGEEVQPQFNKFLSDPHSPHFLVRATSKVSHYVAE